jgi:hypothetical protein
MSQRESQQPIAQTRLLPMEEGREGHESIPNRALSIIQSSIRRTHTKHQRVVFC